MNNKNNFYGGLLVMVVFFALAADFVILQADDIALARISGRQISPSSSQGLTSINITVAVPKNPNLTLTLNPDNISIDLNWTDSLTEGYYNVYFSSNLSLIENLDISNIPTGVSVIYNLSDRNWTDYNADQDSQRYYRVAGINSAGQNLSTDTGCKFDFVFTASSAKSISLPCFPNNLSLNNVLRPSQTYNARNPDTIRLFYRYNGQNKQRYAEWYGKEYGWYSSSTPDPLEYLEPGIGYYMFPINNTYNNTITGLLLENYSVTLNFYENSPKTIGAPYPKYYPLADSLHPAQGLDFLNPDKIRMFYAGSGGQKYSYWFGTSNGWVSYSAVPLTYLEPGVGYYLHPINNSYSDTINFSSGVVI
ncbi:hypothetical protein ACFL0W_06380 [Nanoarchaeota archaeon]